MKLAPPDAGAIKGRTAIVTGAASGIGRAIATGFARDGAVVVGIDRNGDALDTLRDHGVVPVVGDVTHPAVLGTAVAAALDRTDRIDVLINNAGYGLRKRVEDLADGEFEAVLAVHVFASVYGIRAVAPIMRRHHHGRIVNVVSRAAEACQPANSAYSAGKAALWAVSRAAAAELADDNVLVNSLIPGMTNTAIWGRPRPELQDPDAVYPTALALATLPEDGPAGRVFWDLAEYPLFERTLGAANAGAGSGA